MSVSLQISALDLFVAVKKVRGNVLFVHLKVFEEDIAKQIFNSYHAGGWVNQIQNPWINPRTQN